MTHILVLGGYGVFGRRAAERLARHADLTVIVAGRSEARAKAAAAEITRTAKARIGHAVFDATTLTPAHLRQLGTSIVLNTVGPFQEHDYRVAEAAIAAGCHYIDIADAREFVTGIGKLDGAAKAAGVLVVAGASSVPALAAAVIDAHLPRFRRLTHITYGISPGNTFDPGVATVASILGGVGRSFTTLREGRMRAAHGWQPLTRHRFRGPGVGTRWLGACDVPDLDLFPRRYPDLVSQTFFAGVEVKPFHLGIWLLSWLARSGLLRRPERIAGPMLGIKRRLGFLGSDRGAMFMTMAGRGRDGRALRLTWELVAQQSHGPNIPPSPAVILAKQLAAGALQQRGAMPCVGLIDLAAFSAEVADLSIAQSIAETPPLYRRVLGADFDCLPAEVQALHELAGRSVWTGQADVERGSSLIARLAGWSAGLPAAGRAQPLEITFTGTEDGEYWHRAFGSRHFSTTQSEAAGGAVSERVGLSRLTLVPKVTAEGLGLTLAGMTILGIPLPRRLRPRITTLEREIDGRYHFDVACRLPWGALLVHYRGWLQEAR